MTGEITITPTVNIPLPVPSSSSASQAVTSLVSGDTQSQQVHGQSQSEPVHQQDSQQSSQMASSANHSNNNSDSTNNSNRADKSDNGNTKFSQVLAASQNGKSSGSQSSGQFQSQQGQAATNGNVSSGEVTATASTAATGSGSGAGGPVVTSNIISLLMTLQAQTTAVAPGDLGGGANGTNTNAVSGGQATVSSQDNNLLQQLQQLLQQLLQQASSLPQGAQVASTTPTQDASSSGNSGGQQQNGNNSDNNSLAQMMAQLLAILNQFAQQPNIQSLSSNLSTMTVTGGGGQSTADILAQFAQSIQNSLASGANGATANDNTANGANTGNAGNTAPNVFDNLVNALMKSVNTTVGQDNANQSVQATQDPAAQLQKALSDIVNILTATPGSTLPATDASSSGNGNSNNNANDNNAGNNAAINGAVVPVANNTQVLSTDFLKLVQAPAHPTPVTDQVLVQIQSAAKTGANTITIQLNPTDLGKVDVRMVTNADGTTHINITADNRATLAMLQSEAQSLQAALRDVGLKTNMGSLSFNLGGQQQNPSNFNGNQGGYTKAVSSVDAIDENANYGTTLAYYQLSAQSGLNITV